MVAHDLILVLNQIFLSWLSWTVVRRCRKIFSQWQRSFQWQLWCHWLKLLRRRRIAIFIQGPVMRVECEEWTSWKRHDDVIKWKHFRVNGPLCREFTGHRWVPLTKASDAELWCFLWYVPWINGLVNNREAGNLRAHRAHYDVIVMLRYVCHSMWNHWGRVTQICVSKQLIIGSDNGLSPGRRQAVIWTNAGTFLIGPLGTNFSEILIEVHTFSFTKMHLETSTAKRRPFCLGLNVLIEVVQK